MKPILPAAWLLICLSVGLQPIAVQAASAQDKPAASTTSKKASPAKATPSKSTSAKKAASAKKPAAAVKKRPPIASKSKPASEVVKTQLPPANIDLSLPRDMVEDLDPVGTVPLPKHDPVLPQMFGEKGNSQFQLNGRLISNEMQLQLRNEERHEVDGAALEFEFKR
ncbi:translation initiation factor 2 [Pseudomonas sp. C1C7]|uniref:translation initiation factor 2 n=1 Tax=Pseudomonas sp. C1C7 TaxID=2735272 RepID=UPI001585F229|nr:translation initiation factor 2 [Pseudomonas sp. C1C7]NUT77040.1 translation initiation factor 2 [Pseudomonas sp. C1C7]